MERGYDKLANPVGQLIIVASLFLISAIVIAGSFAWKRAMKRDEAMRKAYRDQQTKTENSGE